MPRWLYDLIHFFDSSQLAPSAAQSPLTPSPNGTVVLAGSGGSIIDSSGNTWTLADGVVMENGSAAGFSANAIEIARHRDVEACELFAFGVEEEDVGLSDRDADQIGAPGAADNGIGDLRVGDQHILDVAWQVDHDRLADAERHEAGACVTADDLVGRDGAVGRNCGVE